MRLTPMQGPNATPEDLSPLDRAIAAAGLTPAQVAHRLHARPETVWRWRRGLSAPNGPHLVGLAAALGIEPAAVLILVAPKESK